MAKPEQKDAFDGSDEPGVGVVKDSVLNRLGDEFSEKLEQRAGLSEELTAIESKMVDRMRLKKITVYKYANRQLTLKEGKVHVRIKTVDDIGDADTGDGE